MKLVLASLALAATVVCAQRSNKAMFGAQFNKAMYGRPPSRPAGGGRRGNSDDADIGFNDMMDGYAYDGGMAGGLDAFFDYSDEWRGDSDEWDYGSNDMMDDYWYGSFDGSAGVMDPYDDSYDGMSFDFDNDMSYDGSMSYDDGWAYGDYAYDGHGMFEEMKSDAWCGEMDDSFIKWCSSSWKQKRACDLVAHDMFNTVEALMETWENEGTSFDQLPGMVRTVGDLLLVDYDSAIVLSGGMGAGAGADMQTVNPTMWAEISDRAGYVYSQDGREENLNFVCHLDLNTQDDESVDEEGVDVGFDAQDRRANPKARRLAKAAKKAAKRSSKKLDMWRSFIIAAPIAILE